MDFKTRPCKDCSTLIPWVKYRVRCISCYLKYREIVPNKFFEKKIMELLGEDS